MEKREEEQGRGTGKEGKEGEAIEEKQESRGRGGREDGRRKWEMKAGGKQGIK